MDGWEEMKRVREVVTRHQQNGGNFMHTTPPSTPEPYSQRPFPRHLPTQLLTPRLHTPPSYPSLAPLPRTSPSHPSLTPVPGNPPLDVAPQARTDEPVDGPVAHLPVAPSQPVQPPLRILGRDLLPLRVPAEASLRGDGDESGGGGGGGGGGGVFGGGFGGGAGQCNVVRQGSVRWLWSCSVVVCCCL